MPSRELAPPTAEQARTFLAAVADHPLEALFLPAIGTGACQGELLALRWDAVDLEHRCTTIRYTLQPGGTLAEPKTGAADARCRCVRRSWTRPAAPKIAQASQRLSAGAVWHDGDSKLQAR